MVVGFLGTLIAMERSVALRHPLGYLTPALLGVGGILLLTPAPQELAQLLFIEGAIAFVVVYILLWRRSQDVVVAVQLLGAIHLLIATFLWLTTPIPQILPWFIGFLLLTITAERVELARLYMPRSVDRVLVLAATSFTLAVTLSLWWPDLAARLGGVIMVVFTMWLIAYDVARTFIKTQGLPRFSAAALLSGYFWLIVASIIWLTSGLPQEGYIYDAAVHAVMLGFAMSMIMAHAPIILPAVLRRPLPYRGIMWIPLALLHLGLVVRVFLGDLPANDAAWKTGGVVNVLAVLAFVLVAVTSSLTAQRSSLKPTKERSNQ